MSYSKPVDSNTNTNASSSVKNQVSQGPGPLSPPSSKKSSLRKLLNLKGLMKPMIVIMDEEAEERGEEDEVPKLSNLIIDIKMEDILLDLVLCNDANMNKIIKVFLYAPKKHMHVPGTIIRGMDSHLIPNPCIKARMFRFSPPIEDYIRIFKEGKWKVPENFEKPPGISLPPWHYRLFAPKDPEEDKESQLKKRVPPKGWIHPYSDPARRHLYFPTSHNRIKAYPSKSNIITTSSLKKHKYFNVIQKNKSNSIQSFMPTSNLNSIHLNRDFIMPPPGINVNSKQSSSNVLPLAIRHFLPSDLEYLLIIIKKLEENETSEHDIYSFFKQLIEESYVVEEDNMYEKDWVQSLVLQITKWENPSNFNVGGKDSSSSHDLHGNKTHSLDYPQKQNNNYNISNNIKILENGRIRHYEHVEHFVSNSNDKHSNHHKLSHLPPNDNTFQHRSHPNPNHQKDKYGYRFTHSYHYHKKENNDHVMPLLSPVNSEPLGHCRITRSNTKSRIPYSITPKSHKRCDEHMTNSHCHKMNDNAYDGGQKNKRFRGKNNYKLKTDGISKEEKQRRAGVIFESLFTGKIIKANNKSVKKTLINERSSNRH